MKRGLLFLAVLLMGFAVKGVAQADGEYYLYNEATKMFLSRGENYGTRAIVDKYGIPVAWNATDASLKVLDSNADNGKNFLFQTGTTIYTDGVSTGFAFEETTDGYYLKSNQSGSYLTLAAGTHLHQVVALTTEASAATVWQLKTKAEHDEIVGEYANRNLENVATAAGLSVSADAFVTTLGSSFTAVDMTASIGTAKFTDGAGDWTYTGVRSQGGQPKYGTDYCEIWQATGNYTQTITGLAEGIYKVTVNAFERSGDVAACVAMAQNGYEITTATLSANAEEVALKSWYSERSSDKTPNTTSEAISDFAAGKYLNEVYTYVGADGELKLTLAKPGHVANNWVIFNNFTLTYYKEKVMEELVKGDTLENAQNEVIYYLTESRNNGATYWLHYKAEKDGILTVTPSTKSGLTLNLYNNEGQKYSTSNSDLVQDYTVGYRTKGLLAGDEVYIEVGIGTASVETPGTVTLTFAEGTPYSPITLNSAQPAEGEVYSTALTYGSSKAGVATYKFSGKVSLTDLVASVKVGEKVYSPLTLNTGTSSATVNLQSLPDTIKAAKEAGLLKAGDSFTVTLSNIHDASYAVNTVADQSFTYTLASTACTGVTPTVSGKPSTFPESATFSFDGAVSLDGAKVYYVNTATAEQTEITTATVEGTSVTVPLPAVTTLLPPKKFSVVIEGLKDEAGNILTYPADGEEGKVVAAYEMNDFLLKLESCTPERGASVFSLKTFDLKFNAPVQYLGNAIKVSYTDMTYEEVEVATGSVTIDEADPTKATITLDKEVTEARDYTLNVPTKTFGTADGYFASSMIYSYTVLPFGIKSSVPANESIVLSLSELELTFSADAALVEKGTTVSLKNEAGEEVAVGTLKEDTEDYAVINVEFDKTIDTKGAYTVTIPAGAVKEYDGENVNAEVTYTINVDPEYWDPSWVVDLPGGDEYKEAPTELIVDRKYNIANSGTTYVTYTATETGRLYFNTNYNQSTTIRTTDGPDSWYIRKTLNGTQDEETANYSYWMGVQAGETYYITFYYYGKSRIFDLVFEAGQPYEPIAVTQTSHKDGDLYSRAIRTDLSYQYGAVDFRFNTGINADEVKAYVVLPSKDNAKIDVTSKNKLGSGNLYYAVCLGDTIEAIKEKYELKVGDKIQVVLENVQDQDFADNKLAENPSVELTLAGIVCSSVYPYEDNAQESVPSEIELTFDGEVVYGTGYVLDLVTNEKTDIPAANFVLGEPTTDRYGITTYQAILTLPEVTLSNTTKKFAVVLEDLKDKDGNVITYGETEGKFTLTYSLTDDRFAIESIDPANGAEVTTSLQTIKFTFADNVNLATGENAPYLTNYGDFEMEGTLSVDANDPKTIIMTLNEAVTTPGEYYIVLPEGWIYNSLYDASKEDLGLADGAIYNPYYTSSVIIPADFSDITVTDVTPDTYANTGSTVEELPAEIVVTFSAAVKEITAIYGLGSGGATPYAMEETPEGADALTATIDGEKVKIQVPAEVIAANTYGEYQIVLGVVDAEGKAVGANPNDSYDGHVVLSYYIQPSLKLVSYTPEGENLEKVEKIVLTFSTDVYPEYDPNGMSPWLGGIELKDADGKAVGGELTYTFSGKEVTITPATALTEKGVYQLSIPEGLFYESSFVLDDWYTTYLYNKEINLNFFVQMTNPAVANLTTAVADAKAWIATLDATNADHADVIALVNPLIEEGEAILADLNNHTLEEIQAQADALNEAVSAWKERFEKQVVVAELEALVARATQVYESIDEATRTDEAGLQATIQSADRIVMQPNWYMLEDILAAKEELEKALDAFIAENNLTVGVDIDANKEVVAVKYFTLSGVELTEPVEGVIVKKTLYADGTVTTVKMVVKK